ncbi:MAG: hypothetical protein AAGE94_05235 [Acidobacteriota bacterium]
MKTLTHRRKPIALRTLLVAILLVAIVGADTMAAETCPSNPPWKANLTDALGDAGAGDGSDVLAYDHERATWCGFVWNGSALDSIATDTFKVRFDGQAELKVDASKPLFVYLVGTNPLLYTLSRSAATEEDTPDAARLKQFVGLLRNVVTQRVEFLGRLAAEDSASDSDDEDALVALADVVFDEDAQAAKAKELEAQRARAAKLADQLSSAMRPDPEELFGAVREEAEALGSLAGAVDSLTRGSNQLTDYVQRIERGLPPSASFDVSESISDRLTEAWASVREATHALQAMPGICEKPLEMLAEMARLSSEAHGDLAKPAARFVTLRSDLDLPDTDDVLAALCGFEASDDERRALARAIRETRDWLGDLAPIKTGRPDIGIREHLLALLVPYNSALDRRAELLKAADETENVAGALVKKAAADEILVAQIDADEDGTISAAESQRLVDGVVRFERPQGEAIKIKVGKVRTEGFQIVADPRFKGRVVLDHPTDVEAKYRLVREAASWDFDFGLVYTDLASHEFSAVSSSADETAACEDVDECKIIDRTGEDTRAGDTALFATRLFGDEGKFRWGPQIGVGIDTDDPALFAGVGFALSKSVKLSVGYTYQEVTRLDEDEQMLGQVVQSTDDIKTKQDWEGEVYFGVSITLNGLSLFEPDDD